MIGIEFENGGLTVYQNDKEEFSIKYSKNLNESGIWKIDDGKIQF